MEVTGRVALVTGAGRGIGRAVALKLASTGAAVVVNSLNTENAAAVVAEIVQNKGQAIAIQADVSREDAVTRMVDEVVSAYGHVDILVNNAGITSDQLLLRMTDAEWQRVIDVDLHSVFLCSRAVLRPMLKGRWGRIINMASVVGLVGNPGQTNYAAAKAGIIGFTRALSKEVGTRSVTVNAVAPGFIQTDMTAGLTDPQRADLTARIPLGYLGEAADVAGLVAFLASEEARYITGQVIAVDGGMTGS
jgi:3-oxoacyl-[acyl-carrier protein] reductase